LTSVRFRIVATGHAILSKRFHTSAMKVLATPVMQLKFKQLVLDPMPLELKLYEKLIKATGIK
jgi:hypothetical protein